jgi:hypothetical protein
MSALSWREVWKIWRQDFPSTAPSAPCMMDFLLYRIGKEYCNDKLVEFFCENGHKFYYFGAQKKMCRFCGGHITPLDHFLPCQLLPSDLPRDENNNLMIKESNLLRTFDGICIFESTCQPKNEGFLKLSPPKSISIMGQTGWTESYSNRDEGGGGMMG